MNVQAPEPVSLSELVESGQEHQLWGLPTNCSAMCGSVGARPVAPCTEQALLQAVQEARAAEHQLRKMLAPIGVPPKRAQVMELNILEVSARLTTRLRQGADSKRLQATAQILLLHQPVAIPKVAQRVRRGGPSTVGLTRQVGWETECWPVQYWYLPCGKGETGATDRFAGQPDKLQPMRLH